MKGYSADDIPRVMVNEEQTVAVGKGGSSDVPRPNGVRFHNQQLSILTG